MINNILKIKKLDNNVVLPTYAHEGDSGLDLRAAVDVVIPAWKRAKIPTGIAIELPNGKEAQIRPRSGLFANHGIMAALGTIDYGEIYEK